MVSPQVIGASHAEQVPTQTQAAQVDSVFPVTRTTLLLCVLKLLDGWSFYVVNNILTLYLTERMGYSDAMAGVAFGIRGSLAVIFATLFGPLVDVNPVRCLQVGFLLNAVGRLCIVLSPGNLVNSVVLFFLIPAGHSLGMPVVKVAMKRCTTSENVTAAFAALYWSLVLGIFLSGPTVDLVTISIRSLGPLDQYGLLFLFTAVLSMFGVFVSAALQVPAGQCQQEHVCDVNACKEVATASRFWRFLLYSLLSLPGHLVLRNLDGGMFPKFMVRAFGSHVAKGSIYAINPGLDLIFVPLVTHVTQGRVAHFDMIHCGLAVAAASPLLLALLPLALRSVILFIFVLTLGDLLYQPRLDAYAMAVAPAGREGTFMAAASLFLFLSDVPVGLVGGFLLERFCPQPSCVLCTAAGALPRWAEGQNCTDEAMQRKWQSGCEECICPALCDGATMFKYLALVALATPMFLLMRPFLVDPKARLAGLHTPPSYTRVSEQSDTEEIGIEMTTRS